MNRLIIIGNGFDLGNELKTSYEDFLLWCFNSKIKQALKNEASEYKSAIFDIKINRSLINTNVRFRYSKNLKEIFATETIFWGQGVGVYYRNKTQKDNEKLTRPIIITLNSQFFATLISHKGNWTDIEKYYFASVLRTKQNHRYVPDLIKKLNDDFEVIKNELKNYIQIIDHKNLLSNKDLDLLKLKKGDFFYRLFTPNLTDYLYYVGLASKTKNSLVVNFNYTNTIKNYLDKIHARSSSIEIQVVDIHGNCMSDQIIFGYGDESHVSYQELEDQDDNELLKNMKSFYYGFSADYSKLMAFIDKEDFVVDVIGHSLGLSDRLLFREIFERKNCKKIKLFHRGTKESYFNKRIALSRHFKDNTNMRNKVMEYSELDVF